VRQNPSGAAQPCAAKLTLNNLENYRMRKLIVVMGVLLLGMAAAQAQMSVEIGASTVKGNISNSLNYSPQTIAGGTYLNLDGDYVFWHNVGFGGGVMWRAGQADWGGTLPYRPIFFHFDGVYGPKLGKRAALDLRAGIGFESLHFYTGSYSCGYFGCSNYQSTTHFMGSFGGGIRLYPTSNIFIEPQAGIFLVHNNFEFTGPRVAHYGLSIGYTFGEH
jgi:hypothetical protein